MNKPVSENNIGESWEISGVKNNVTKVENGIYQNKGLNDLVKQFKGKLLGKENYQRYGEEFPLLIKFIDANENLSVQLHPDDDLARERHNSFGKNEMWYLMDTEQDSFLNLGLKKNVQETEVLQAIENNNLVDLLNFQKVHRGESYFIKAGKIHAIGGGIVLAEIQQTSDITYRIYDWG
ncbi:type I phosphomannose isomerase catalytic subunit [Gramella sp. MAR_2010_147]|uniref:type I phosphomannose isomerase catalytic subunit n=1 Tax=Gramella sp. MAR_2010_147 TaxID=1250205 RepID=UPI000B20B44F|nr:type I phosphomannose isomerase catalytic subunit [Gramella sp. MAR_2010_147]